MDMDLTEVSDSAVVKSVGSKARLPWVKFRFRNFSLAQFSCPSNEENQGIYSGEGPL